MINNKIKEKNAELAATPTPAKTIQIPKDDFDINELQIETAAKVGFCSNVEPVKKTDYRYRLADQFYKDFAIKGLKYINTKNPAQVTLWFEDKSSLVDFGNTIAAKGGTDQDNAARIVALAKLKGWKAANFDGSDSFVKAAMTEALKNGLEVHTLDEKQEKMLQEIQATLNTSSASKARKVNKIADDFDDLFNNLGDVEAKKGGVKL